MSSYLFDLMTQDQASTVTNGDIIGFATTSVNARNVIIIASPENHTISTIIITADGKSLTFNQQSLSDLSEADSLVFNDESALRLGTNGNDVPDDFDLSATRPNTVYGFAGDDIINVIGGNDYVFAGNGADTVNGGAGNEHIYGFGLTGNPTADGADSLSGAGGNDYIQGNAGADILDGGPGNDRLVGGAGADSIRGSSGQDTINGNTGNDAIDGGADEDSIRGGQGNDALSGNSANDILLGDLGDDTLDGGTGIDILTGGDGADLFQFGTGDATGFATTGAFAYFTDEIRDFVEGTDEIRLTAATGTVGDEANEIVYGQAGASFSSVSAARDYAQALLNNNMQANDVVVVRVGNDTYLFYDATGVQGAAIDSIVKVAGLTDTSLLTVADFS